MTIMASAEEESIVERARSRIGTVLKEKWTLDGLLGVGGMAIVYSATHRNGKRVAVKVLRDEFTHDEQVRTRFLREGYAANALQDEGAVSVLDDDIAADGSAFIVMELLEGETLEQRWERAGRKLEALEVLSFVYALLGILEVAHGRSVIHRDIKPDNLFVTRTGALKVLDFGIAKVFEAQPSGFKATRAGTIMGTPAFMAPEQARARWDEVDGRTDLWAVGATMFALLSGRHVHEADNGTDQLIQTATCPAPPLLSVAPEVPHAVAALVDRALAFERTSRWPGASEMREAVRAAMESLGGPPVPSVPGRSLSPSFAGDAGDGAEVPSHITSRSQQDSASQRIVPAAAPRSAVRSVDEEAQEVDLAKLRAGLAEIQSRLATAKTHTAAAQATLEGARRERASLVRWFQRQAGTRTAAVEEARREIRQRSIAVARQVLCDTSSFNSEVKSACADLVRLENASASAARDVAVHEAALTVYDAHAVRVGIVTVLTLVVAVLASPFMWRMMWVGVAAIRGMVLR